ncbi:MAG: glycosyltransferase family 2 protein [Rhodocyclaceae bacterium]|nr:glycosyltransferase family 2 protein [Rhodocyclaceae bacterium]
MKPGFSVIVPLYNKGAHIDRTLSSLLGQGFTDFEAIIVDDGSSDDGPARVAACTDPRITLVRQANQGASAARNAGVAMAQGAYAAFLDADDEWSPDFLETLAALIEEAPGAALYATAYREIGPQGEVARVSAKGLPPGSLDGSRLDYLACVAADRYPFYTSSCCVEVVAFRRAGGFDTALAIGEDIDLWLRLAFDAGVRFDPRACASYRRDAGNRAMEHPLRAERLLAFVERLDRLRREYGSDPAREALLARLLAANLVRSVTSFARRGDIAMADTLMARFHSDLSPKEHKRLSRKLLKHRLIGFFRGERHAQGDSSS